MNRRGFLKGFLAVTGTLAIAPNIALAAPPKQVLAGAPLRLRFPINGNSINGYHADIIIIDDPFEPTTEKQKTSAKKWITETLKKRT